MKHYRKPVLNHLGNMDVVTQKSGPGTDPSSNHVSHPNKPPLLEQLFPFLRNSGGGSEGSGSF